MFAYSLNEENYHGKYDTREEAITAAILDEDAALADEVKLVLGQSIWTGKCVERTASNYFSSINQILEDMQERSYDEIGEWCDNWLKGITDQQIEELSSDLVTIIDAWATKHVLHPKFYLIENIQEHVLTEDMISTANKENRK